MQAAHASRDDGGRAEAEEQTTEGALRIGMRDACGRGLADVDLAGFSGLAVGASRLSTANPFVESFNSRVRAELPSVEIFTCLTEAKVMVEDFRQDYTRSRRHRAHGMMTLAALAEGWRTARQAAPASAELQPA